MVMNDVRDPLDMDGEDSGRRTYVTHRTGEGLSRAVVNPLGVEDEGKRADLIELLVSELVARGIEGVPGEDGASVELRIDGGWVQWRVAGDATWTNLIELASLQGPQGDPGPTEPATTDALGAVELVSDADDASHPKVLGPPNVETNELLTLDPQPPDDALRVPSLFRTVEALSGFNNWLDALGQEVEVLNQEVDAIPNPYGFWLPVAVACSYALGTIDINNFGGLYLNNWGLVDRNGIYVLVEQADAAENGPWYFDGQTLTRPAWWDAADALGQMVVVSRSDYSGAPSLFFCYAVEPETPEYWYAPYLQIGEDVQFNVVGAGEVITDNLQVRDPVFGNNRAFATTAELYIAAGATVTLWEINKATMDQSETWLIKAIVWPYAGGGAPSALFKFSAGATPTAVSTASLNDGVAGTSYYAQTSYPVMDVTLGKANLYFVSVKAPGWSTNPKGTIVVTGSGGIYVPRGAILEIQNTKAYSL